MGESNRQSNRQYNRQFNRQYLIAYLIHLCINRLCKYVCGFFVHVCEILLHTVYLYNTIYVVYLHNTMSIYILHNSIFDIVYVQAHAEVMMASQGLRGAHGSRLLLGPGSTSPLERKQQWAIGPIGD